MCSVDFSDADIIDAPSKEYVGITGDIPGSICATHIWLWTLL